MHYFCILDLFLIILKIKFPKHIAERERERTEEKKQRVSGKKMATTITTGKVEETPKLIEVEASTTESAVSQQLSEDGGSEVAASDGTKELKIEVHATAVHHEKLDPIVAHAQAHDLSHESAPVILNLPPFRIKEEELQERENLKHEMKTRVKRFLLLLLFDFEFSAHEIPHS